MDSVVIGLAFIISSACEKYGRSVGFSHAKAHALLKGELIVEGGLPPELAQGLFAQPGRYEVLIRMAQAPGELLDDSKLSTDRGMSVKVLGVNGPKLEGHTADTQDWVFDVGKQFLASGMKKWHPNCPTASRVRSPLLLVRPTNSAEVPA